jgi:hypothetical protein
MAQIIRSEPSKKVSAKQPTTICSIGTSDRLRSPIEQFNRSFVGKRVLKTSFLLSGQSKRDTRKCFANIFRHTYHSVDGAVHPWNEGKDFDLLIPRRILNPKHQLKFNGLPISTDEVQLDHEYPDADGNEVLTPVEQIREFWSPYNLQELENLSWNLNRRKCLPYGLNVSQQNAWTLNQDINFNPAQVASGDGSSLYGPAPIAQQGFSFVKGKIAAGAATHFMSDKLVSEPMLTDVAHTHAEGESNMRKILKLFTERHTKEYDSANDSIINKANANFQPKHEIGKYYAQISSGAVYYTFENTGDTDMIVDMVVHKIKDGMGVGDNVAGRITDRILDHYGENWMDKRIRGKLDEFADLDSYRPDDVYLNPKVKFLPSSLRLNHNITANAVKAGTNVMVKYRTGDEGQGGADAASQNAQAVEAYNPGGKWGAEYRERMMDLTTPPFTDVYRQQIFVMAGKRKTLALRLPAKAYNPLQSVYTSGGRTADTSVLLNEHGYHVTFGITGKKARTVIEPQEIDAAQLIRGIGSKVIGVHHAATSFKIRGRYYESIVPAVCIEPHHYDEQSLDLEVDIAAMHDDKRIYSAAFNDMTSRDVDGRYIRLGIDGEMTKANQARFVSKANEQRDQRSRAARTEEQLDEDVFDMDTTPDGGGTPTNLGTSLSSKFDQEGMGSAQKKARRSKALKTLDKARRKAAQFVVSVTDSVEWAGDWINGHPHTVGLLKAGIEGIIALATSNPTLAAKAAIDSGVSVAQIEDIKEELMDDVSVIYDNTDLDSVKLHTVSNKRRRLLEDDYMPVYVDEDPDTSGIQPLTASGGGGSGGGSGGTMDVNITGVDLDGDANTTEALPVNIAQVTGSNISNNTVPVQGTVAVTDGGNGSLTVDGTVTANVQNASGTTLDVNQTPGLPSLTWTSSGTAKLNIGGLNSQGQPIAPTTNQYLYILQDLLPVINDWSGSPGTYDDQTVADGKVLKLTIKNGNPSGVVTTGNPLIMHNMGESNAELIAYEVDLYRGIDFVTN